MNELQVILGDTVERLFTDAIERTLREDAEAGICRRRSGRPYWKMA